MDIKIGISLISNVYRQERVDIVARSLSSLAKTDFGTLYKPAFKVIYPVGQEHYYSDFINLIKDKVDIVVENDPADMKGAVAIQLYTADNFINSFPDITHIVFLWDDFVYNSKWLLQLEALISRHPDAKAWSIYRSRYTRHHNIVGGDGTDVLMSCHDGIGCVTVENWKYYRSVCDGFYGVPDSHGGGNTPDLHYVYKCPGDRWATSRDYCNNIGLHPGIEDKDQAIDFVGE